MVSARELGTCSLRGCDDRVKLVIGKCPTSECTVCYAGWTAFSVACAGIGGIGTV